MKVVVASFNQEKALEGPFSVIVKLHLRLAPSSGGCSGAGLMSRGGWPGRDCWLPAGRPQLGNLATAVYSQGRYDGTQPEPEPDIWQCSNNQH